MKFIVSKMKDWKEVASTLVERIEPGMIILLYGPLGAGKTTLVQILAAELGIKKLPKSPTFGLIRTYSVPHNHKIKRLVHVDAYRIDSEKDVPALGLDELASQQDQIMAIEWPERLGTYLDKLPGKRLTVTIEEEAISGARRVTLAFFRGSSILKRPRTRLHPRS